MLPILAENLPPLREDVAGPARSNAGHDESAVAWALGICREKEGAGQDCGHLQDVPGSALIQDRPRERGSRCWRGSAGTARATTWRGLAVVQPRTMNGSCGALAPMAGASSLPKGYPHTRPSPDADLRGRHHKGLSAPALVADVVRIDGILLFS
jgi:hypothetical protein